MKNLKRLIKDLKKKANSYCNKLCPDGKLPRLKSITILVLALGLVVLFLRFFLIVAVVNGRPITHISLIRELEKQGGQSVLDNLVEKALIFQEATSKNISISNNTHMTKKEPKS